MVTDPRQITALAQMQRVQQQQAELQIMQIVVTIAVNRDKMLGEHGSIHSAAAVEKADRVLLDWLTGIQKQQSDS